ATLSAEGYRLVWYHSTCKAEHDARTRHQQVERALIDLAELRQKLSSPRSRYHQAAKVAEAVQSILKARGVEGWIVTEIKERTEEKYRQDRRGRPNAETRYVKQTSTRFELEYHIDSVQLAAETCCDGVFPLITNDGLLSELELLLAYKGQPSLEKRLSHMKTDGSSVFKCKTSRIGPSGPWPSGRCARSSSRSLATPDSSPGSIGPTDSSLTSVHRYAW